MHEQPSPDLPPDGVGVIPEEVGELNGLLDFFKEEDLDIPARPVDGRLSTRSTPDYWSGTS